MTNVSFSYENFENIRDVLISEVHARLSGKQRQYLLSLQEGTPDWTLLELEGISDLPAVKWKLENIQKMSTEKRAATVNHLKRALKI